MAVIQADKTPVGREECGGILRPFINTSHRTLSVYSLEDISAELPCYFHQFVFRWKPYVPPLYLLGPPGANAVTGQTTLKKEVSSLWIAKVYCRVKLGNRTYVDGPAW